MRGEEFIRELQQQLSESQQIIASLTEQNMALLEQVEEQQNQINAKEKSSTTITFDMIDAVVTISATDALKIVQRFNWRQSNIQLLIHHRGYWRFVSDLKRAEDQRFVYVTYFDLIEERVGTYSILFNHPVLVLKTEEKEDDPQS